VKCMMEHPLDPFRTILIICSHTDSKLLVDQTYKLFEQLAENDTFGNGLFKFEKVVRNLVHPPTPHSDNGGEEELSDSKSSDSDVDQFYDDIINMDGMGGSHVDAAQHREEASKNRDHISIIQDFISSGRLIYDARWHPTDSER
jgi:hypothetical protein